MRSVLERASILKILEEPEFAHTITARVINENKPANDYFFAVLVFTAESQDDGSLLLRVISTTVVGIQRFTTSRLRLQGVYVVAKPHELDLISEALRAHFRAQQEDTNERLASIGPRGMPLGWFKRHFPNGAGDLSSPPEFVISDPEFEELEKFLNTPDTRSESDDLEE